MRSLLVIELAIALAVGHFLWIVFALIAAKWIVGGQLNSAHVAAAAIAGFGIAFLIRRHVIRWVDGPEGDGP